MLHVVSRIAHDACMGTTGDPKEAGESGESGGVRATARRAAMGSTGVAP